MAVPAVAAAGLIAGAVTGGVGPGKIRRVGAGWNTAGSDGGYDPNAQFYGGHQGGLTDRVGGLAQASDAARDRQAFQANYQNANWNRAQSAQARGQQQAMAMLMANRAQGLTPSIAQMQADRQMGQAAAEQQSQMAGARGAAGLALAQQNAAGNTAAMQSGISNQAQINAAQERLAAEQAAFGAYGGMRQQDAGMMGQEAQMAQFQAGLQQQNRAANDQTALGYQGLINQAQLGEMQARTQAQGTLASAYGHKEGLEFQREATNKANQGWIENLIGVPSDVTAKTDVTPLEFSAPTYHAPQVAQAPEKKGGGLDIGAIAGMFSSDRRAKEDARAEGLVAGMLAAKNQGAMSEQDSGMTQQLAGGLAPFSYKYKEGFGTPGTKVGPMAQSMASNPVTATAVRQDPGTGLLAIDRDDGLKVALGGVGHLAQKQQAQENALAALIARDAPTQQGLMAQRLNARMSPEEEALQRRIFGGGVY